MCHLFIVLLGLCSLLAMPETENPLVPEAMEPYLRERDVYLATAREQTSLHVTGVRPSAELEEKVESRGYGFELSDVRLSQ